MLTNQALWNGTSRCPKQAAPLKDTRSSHIKCAAAIKSIKKPKSAWHTYAEYIPLFKMKLVELNLTKLDYYLKT